MSINVYRDNLMSINIYRENWCQLIYTERTSIINRKFFSRVLPGPIVLNINIICPVYVMFGYHAGVVTNSLFINPSIALKSSMSSSHMLHTLILHLDRILTQGSHTNINPLLDEFFRLNTNIFIFDVISPYWYDTGSWNHSSSKTRTFLFYIVNIMAADVLATKGAGTSATQILT